MSRSPGEMMPQLPPMGVAMAGLDPAAIGVAEKGAAGGERVRGMIAWLAGAGARGVQIDATMAGIRPRELDRSGRRDLAALLRRSELAVSGVDVFVPPEHLLKADTVDRAVSSVLGAVDLAADLTSLASGAVVTRLASGGGWVSLTLPAKTPPDVRAAIADHAQGRGVRIADFVWPIAEKSVEGAMGVGLDPAMALSAGQDPVALAASLGKRLMGARLSDVAKSAAVGAGRVAPGDGRLDLMAYLVTLATVGFEGSVVLDLHGLREPGRVVRDVITSGP